MPHYLARWGTEREAYAKLRLNMLTIQLDDVSSLAMGGDPDVNRELVAEALLEYWWVGLAAPTDAMMAAPFCGANPKGQNRQN